MTSTAFGTVRARQDARAKATGALRYSADLPTEGALHAVVVRSPVPHAEIVGVVKDDAASAVGVVAVVTSADLDVGLAGRRVRDMPVLARSEARYTGEGIAVVLAERRHQAEAAANLVEIQLRELPAVVDASTALSSPDVVVHAAPWEYDGAVVGRDGPPNLQSQMIEGSFDVVEAALGGAAYAIARTYTTPSAHQGYLEPTCWTATPRPDGGVYLQGTTKSPYRLRDQLAKSLGVAVESVEVGPMPIGGDFGGKGSVIEATLCAALARCAGRPVRLALRSGEDLTSTDARHGGTIDVRLGCNHDGRLVALSLDAVFDGGAYAAAKPTAPVNLHGIATAALGYRVGAYAVRSRIAYTHTVPKGHMRAPGAPQAVFAIESAMDELAAASGIEPDELRRRNLLADGEHDVHGHRWPEARGTATLAAALAEAPRTEAAPGWRRGTGMAVYARATHPPVRTSVRLVPGADGSFTVEVPFPDTGTGSHSVVAEATADCLGVDHDKVVVRQVTTGQLPYDHGVGGSGVTVGMSTAVRQLVAAWQANPGDEAVEVDIQRGHGNDDEEALAYCAQVAHVAVDPETGQVRVLELVTAVDVASIVRPRSHRLQIEGGAVMGLGFALLEDLLEEDGQPWAANLGEFRLPTAEDVPALRTVLVEGGTGVGPANVKAVGELTNVPTAAAVANAVADATGARIRQLPITAERVYWCLNPPNPKEGS